MLRSVAILLVLLSAPAVSSAQSLKGVWIMEQSRTIGGPNDGQVIEYEHPRFLIYTDAFFMWAFVGNGDRPTGDLTDAQIVQAVSQYNSVGGTYIRDGATIMYNQVVSVNPNASLPENQPLVREIRTLTANRLVTQATNAQGVTNLNIYRRVE
jgi:hypothetical protein